MVLYKKHDPLLPQLIVESEHHVSEAEGEAPAESSARYRKTGVPRVLALAGVIVGFVLMIVPGIIAARSYRRWQDGTAAEPRASWSVLSLGLGIGAAVALWGQSPLLAAVVGLILSVFGLSLSAP